MNMKQAKFKLIYLHFINTVCVCVKQIAHEPFIVVYLTKLNDK